MDHRGPSEDIQEEDLQDLQDHLQDLMEDRLVDRPVDLVEDHLIQILLPLQVDYLNLLRISLLFNLMVVVEQVINKLTSPTPSTTS